jgi:hypothetical protein
MELLPAEFFSLRSKLAEEIDINMALLTKNLSHFAYHTIYSRCYGSIEFIIGSDELLVFEDITVNCDLPPEYNESSLDEETKAQELLNFVTSSENLQCDLATTLFKILSFEFVSTDKVVVHMTKCTAPYEVVEYCAEDLVRNETIRVLFSDGNVF